MHRLHGNKGATIEYRHLVAIDDGSASITIQSSQRQTPSFDDASLGATLIKLFANDRIATNRIPDGITFAAEPTKPLGSISLRVNKTRNWRSQDCPFRTTSDVAKVCRVSEIHHIYRL